MTLPLFHYSLLLYFAGNSNASFLRIPSGDQNVPFDGKNTDGKYYLQMRLVDNVVTAEMRTVALLNGGTAYIDTNGLGSTLLAVYYDVNGDATTLISSIPSNTRDYNFVIPNYAGRLGIQGTCNGCGGNKNLFFDNIRYQPLPLLVLDSTPFNTHIVSGSNFTIDLNYAPGYTCYVKDDNTSTLYSTSYQGNNIYRTNNLQFTLSTGQTSLIKDFSAQCGSQSNDDYRWKLKINQHDLLSSNGGFDNNSVITVTSSTTTAVKDWEVNITGTGEFDIIKNTSTAYKSTDGQYYARIKPGLSGTNVELQSKSVLFGGSVYFDSNYFNAGASPANNLKAIYYYENGGSTTLFDSSSNIVGQDKNISIPNQYGKLALSLGGSNDNLSEFIFDNVRYSGGSSLCKPVIWNGNSNEKIDIVFVGSGFSDLNQFRSSVEFLLDYAADGDGLFSYEPFKTDKNKFNVWLVDKYKIYNLIYSSPVWKFENPFFEPEDSIQRQAMEICPQGNEFVAISVYPRFRAASANVFILGDPIGVGGHFAQLTVGCELLGQCPYPVDANFVDPYTSYCDGNGTIFKTPSTPTVGCDMIADTPAALQRDLVHEFGHSFGGLADEYLVGGSTPLTNFAPNCDANNVCSKWSNFSGIVCVPGCSYSAWQRPYQKSVMLEHRVDRQEYGEVSEKELGRDINGYIEITGGFTTFLWGVSYQNGDFIDFGTMNNTGVSSIFTNQPSNYRLKVYSKNGNLLMDANFLIQNQMIFETSNVIFDSNGNQVSLPDINTMVEFVDENFNLPIPGFTNIGRAEIYDNGLLKLSTDLSYIDVQYIFGYGGNKVTSNNYIGEYSLVPQPTGVLNSTNYIVRLGWIFTNE